MGHGGGKTNAVLCIGGGNPPGIQTESWNGTSWTEVNDMAKARVNLATAGGANVTALAMGSGSSPEVLTEEFTADNALSTVTVS